MNRPEEPKKSDASRDIEHTLLALQAAGIGTWDLNLQTNEVWWDAICKQLYGYAQHDVVPYEQVLSQVHPDDQLRVHEAVQWALNPASDGQYKIQFRTLGAGDGRIRWLHCKGKAFFDSKGQALRFSGTAEEITFQSVHPQAVAQRALIESEARFRSLIREAPVATCLFVGRELVIEVANEAMIQVWGKGPNVLGMPLGEALPELRSQHFLTTLDTLFLTGDSFQAKAGRADLVKEGRLQTFYFDYDFKPLRDSNGTVYAILETAVDVTEQVVAHQLLRERERQFSTLVESVPDVITRWDRNRQLVFANEAFVAKTDQSLSSLLGKTNQEMGQPHDIAQPYMESLQTVLESGQPRLHYNKFPTPQGEVYYYSRLVPEIGLTGEVEGVLAIARDVTQLKQLENTLEQQVAERTQELVIANEDLRRSNENLQQFAYVASHDLQEPLRKIQTFADLLAQSYGEHLGREGRALLQRLTASGARMSLLVKDLLAYSRVSTRQEVFGLVSLNTIVNDAIHLFDWIIQQREAQLELEELPAVKGDESQLGQLFTNLVGNALKFTPVSQRPHIRIEYFLRSLSELPPEVHPTSGAPYFHQISITDQGVGFDTRFRKRVFEVFQRLHGPQQFPGTGVGLAICQRVVENHGGGITASSEVGKGATFCVYLPA